MIKECPRCTSLLVLTKKEFLWDYKIVWICPNCYWIVENLVENEKKA